MAQSEFVNTLRGTIPVTQLGRTLMHEHLFVQDPELTRNYSKTWVSNEFRVAAARDKLNELSSMGISTIVDLTVLGLGRDITLMSDVAAGTDVNIVAATGSYVLDRFPYQMSFNPPGTGAVADGLAEWFVSDIVEGIGGTAIRAGVIKCATDVAGLTPDVVTAIRAAGRASVQTGVSVMTHADAQSQRGLEQQTILLEEGVDLARVVIGHAGDSLDLGYLRTIMDAGSTIGMDRFGLGPVSTSDRIRVVADLCALGYADRMVLSHDAACHSEWLDADRMAIEAPEWDFNLVPHTVIPGLLRAGTTEDQIEQMMVRNPRRILATQSNEVKKRE